MEAFRVTIRAAVDFSLAVVETGEVGPPPIPAELLTQARHAARHRLGLDLVLRGYVVGSTLIDDFILEECDSGSARATLRLRSAALEHLISRISDEYERERQNRAKSRECRTFEHVKRLLRGEPLSGGLDLAYDLTFNHVGFVAHGPDPKISIKEVLHSVDCRLFMVEEDPEVVWGWLGRRAPIYADEVQCAIAQRKDRLVSIGIGEASQGISGWRQTHLQAKAALPVARRSRSRLARYADVCVIASASQDSLLASSLRDIYLRPLLVGRDGGATHLRTLRAYFAAHRNGESTAAALGVSRQAVANRLRVVEERLGRPLSSCATVLEIALSLDDIGKGAVVQPTLPISKSSESK